VSQHTLQEHWARRGGAGIKPLRAAMDDGNWFVRMKVEAIQELNERLKENKNSE
jgi:hypothetical protein